MTLAVVPVADAEILARVVAPSAPTMPSASARAIPDLHFNDRDIARMNELAGENWSASLTQAEPSELESYQRVGHFLNLIQAKARFSLGDRDGG